MRQKYLYIILATILFSTMEIALKMAGAQYNPHQLNFLRFFIGGLILLPLALKNIKAKKLSLNSSDVKFFLLQGFICVVISMSCFQLAVNSGKASTVAVLFSSNPVFLILFAYFILKEEIYHHHLLTLTLSLIGIIFIMNPFQMASSKLGVILTLISAISFAFYGIISKTKKDRYGGITHTCLSFLFGSLELFILIELTHLKPIANWLNSLGLTDLVRVPIITGIHLSSLPALIYISIFVTGLGYTFYFLAIEQSSAATASLVFYLKPALAPVLALTILKEAIVPTTIIGIILLVSGSAVTFIAQKQQS
ncbi:DMT family transporter [Halanaerobium salsuginis]|jgi:drug/metabolite transporter (DMT)-like permease|uniref:Threonine/homoserine efflux transporter RhtA n=1 Tax=Halanaerobium salsuginis TaxID=29563 RepID=A0A1I4KJP7_9FIRM|nr:EamA family transporter [Halanaerobium salsuginis]SFL79005.1 Threonine/homoserine efflux transporter RhtA [Halanaerobium salsuginis]